MKRLLFSWLAAVLLPLTVALAQDSRPTIIVAPMKGDTTQIQAWQPACGEGLAEMLVTEISKGTQFEVLESTHVGDLVDEINLGEAGYVAKGEKVNKGSF